MKFKGSLHQESGRSATRNLTLTSLQISLALDRIITMASKREIAAIGDTE